MEEFSRQEYAPHFVTFLPFNNLYDETDKINEFITGCSRVSVYTSQIIFLQTLE